MRTHVSTAALSTFRVPVTPIAVPRRTVYRFRVPADRDLAEVLGRLIGRDVQVLEIRQCPEPPPRGRGPAPDRREADPGDTESVAPAREGVVVPFRAAAEAGRRGGRFPLRRRPSPDPGAGTAWGPSVG